MAHESPDVVSSFIAVVEAKIKALQGLLESLKSAVAVGALGAAEGVDISSLATGLATGEIGQPIDLPDGAFFGKSIPACVKLYMSAAKKKKSIKEIASALREGGVESTSDNFESVVTGALNRLKSGGEVLRFKDGWGLAEWYPANMRASAPPGVKRPKKKSKKGSRKAVEANRDAELTTMPAKGNANERTLELLRSGKRTDYGLVEIGGHLGMGAQGARLILGKLIKAGKVEKTAQDTYRIAQPKLVAASI
jgi:hypothetical protein